MDYDALFALLTSPLGSVWWRPHPHLPWIDVTLTVTNVDATYKGANSPNRAFVKLNVTGFRTVNVFACGYETEFVVLRGLDSSFGTDPSTLFDARYFSASWTHEASSYVYGACSPLRMRRGHARELKEVHTICGDAYTFRTTNVASIDDVTPPPTWTLENVPPRDAVERLLKRMFHGFSTDHPLDS